MKFLPFTLLAACSFSLAGCKTLPPTRTIKLDSDPPGARVFVTRGRDQGDAKSGGRNYVGTTPCQWTVEVNKDGTFKKPDEGIPFYSDFVQSVVMFTAEPPSGATNLFTQREVFHNAAEFQPGNNAPDGVFFDMHKATR